MSAYKLGSAAAVLAACGMSLALTACSTSEDIINYALNDNHESLRAPTGYYEHSDAVSKPDMLKVSGALSQPYKDKTYEIPPVNADSRSQSLIGASMDVRAPIVSQVSSAGVDIQTLKDDSSVVWFAQSGRYAVTDTGRAWNYLHSVLDYLKLETADSNNADKSLIVKSGFFTSYGAPYDEYALEAELLRYRQSYRIQVVKSPAGRVGYKISLLSSETLDPEYDSVKFTTDVINPVQKGSFTAGLGNTLIKGMIQQSKPAEVLPDNVQVLLSRDNNGQDAFLIRAPYKPSWEVLHGVFSQFGFDVTKYSISGSNFRISYEEPDPDDYAGRNVNLVALEEGDYTVRVSVGAQNTTLVTFFDSEGNPLKTDIIAAVYPVFSSLISEEFVIYKGNPANYVAKFREED